jgi:hypothetical protein
MIDPFEKTKTFEDLIDEIEQNDQGDDAFEDMDSLEEMAENEFEDGVVGISDWDEWN